MWHNEQNSCDGVHDQLDWMRMRGAWGEDGKTIFGKTDTPDGYFLLAGIDKKLPSEYSVMLVSDPIQCQEGDGVLRLKFWTSPMVKVHVCIRHPSQGRRYDWCSEPLKRKNGKSAKIVIEAYDFSFDAFGKQGGVAVIDDIEYNATAIYNCRMIPHYDPPINLTSTTCQTATCNFESGDCMEKLEESGWKTSSERVGPMASGVRLPLEGEFGYAIGPGSRSLQLGPFTLPRPFGLQFCYYSSSWNSQFSVQIEMDNETNDKKIVYEGPSPTLFSLTWICERIPLNNGTYKSVTFKATKLRNQFAYVGLDEIAFVDPILGDDALFYKSPPSLAIYRVFIANATLSDLIFGLSTTLAQIRIIPNKWAFAYISLGPAAWIGGSKGGYLMYCIMLHSLFYTFLCFPVSFGFRYYILVKPTPQISSCIKFCLSLWVIALAQHILFILSESPVEEIRTYLAINKPEYNLSGFALSGNHMINSPLTSITLATIVLPMFPIYAMVIYFYKKVQNYLVDNSLMLQKSTIKCHKRLMRALTITASLPLFFIFPPIILYGLYHLEIINSTLIEYLVYTLFSFFPAISPLISIYYVRPYKLYVCDLLGIRPSEVEPGLKAEPTTPSNLSRRSPRSPRPLPSNNHQDINAFASDSL